jgi:hypothetical protein
VLVEDVVSEIEGRLAGGATPADVAKDAGAETQHHAKGDARGEDPRAR